MGNLKAQGYRLMVNSLSQRAEWVHPAVVGHYFDYTDCTDMDDAQFAAFIAKIAA